MAIDVLFAGKIRHHTPEIALIFGEDRKDLKDLLLTLEDRVFTLTQAGKLAHEREEELKLALGDMKKRFEDLMEDDTWLQYQLAEMKEKLGDAWRIVGEKEEEMKEQEETYRTLLKEMQEVHETNLILLRGNLGAEIRGQAETYDSLLKELQGSHDEVDKRILRERYEGKVEITRSQYDDLRQHVRRLEDAALQDDKIIRTKDYAIASRDEHIMTIEREKAAIVETTDATIAQIKRDAIRVAGNLERDLGNERYALRFSKQTASRQAEFIRDITAKYDQMRKDTGSLERDIRDESAAQRAEIEALKAENEALNAQLAVKVEDLSRVVKDRNSLAAELAESEKRVFTAEATCEEYERVQKEKKDIIEDLEARSRITNDLMWAMSARNDTLERECDTAEEEFDAVRGFIKKVARLEEDGVEFISKNIKKPETLTEELLLDAGVSILLNTIKNANVEINILKEKSAKLGGKLGESQNQVCQLRAELHNRDKVIEMQDDELERQNHMRESFDGMMNAVRTTLREKDIKIAAAKKSIQELVERCRAAGVAESRKLIDI